jgi:hypothetical protein
MSLVRAALALLFLSPAPATAMLGGAPAPETVAAQTALIVSTRGASCTGAVLARDLVLTAAHCVEPSADYAIVVFEPSGPRVVPVVRVALHPRFDPAHFKTRRPTPDLALIKISVPLPERYRPAFVERTPLQPRAGEYFTLAGYGVTQEGDGKSAGRLHTLLLPAIGNTVDATGVIMVRLSERGKNAGAELQQLDRVEVLHAAADALGRVEQHVGLGGIGIAQHAHADAVDDQIAAAEVAEGDRRRSPRRCRACPRPRRREAHQRRGWPAAGGCQR